MSSPAQDVNRDDRQGGAHAQEATTAPQSTMGHTRPVMQGVAVAQPPLQGSTSHARPMQHVPHGAATGHMTATGMMQAQPGHAHQNHMLNARHIVSQYQAANPSAQHVHGTRPHSQVPHQALSASMGVSNQVRPRIQTEPVSSTNRQPPTLVHPIAHGSQPTTASGRPVAQVRPSAQEQGPQVPQNNSETSRIFKTKLFALAKEDSEVHDLWYAKGRKIKEENPELNQREWFQRIVKAVYDEARANKNLYQKIWSYNENASSQKLGTSVRPQAPIGQAQEAGAPAAAVQANSANPQHLQMQQAQPLVPVSPVAPGQPRPVVGTAVPLGAAVGQVAQPRPQGVRPAQAMALQPVAGASQYHTAYPAAVGQRPAYPYQQYIQPGVRPSHPLAPQFTEAQRRKAEEERIAREEQKRREMEEKRQRIQEENARKAQLKREKEELARQKKQQAQAERDRKAEIKREEKRKRDEERLRKKEERERQKQERLNKGRKRPAASKAAGGVMSTVPMPADDTPEASLGNSQGKKRPAARKTGVARKKAKADDQPAGVAIDMDDEEAALLGAMLKMGQQHGHKAVLEEDAVLNDAPLRARLKHVAARHGVVVHSGAVKACSLAVELYLRRVLQDMIRMHEIRTGQAKDVPGMVRDLERNWARNVAIIHETEKEAQARARHAQQLQEDQQTIANHASRRRGEELDEEEKAKRKENVDAAKSRLGTAEAQNRVNENLKKLLPQRRFGQRRRLLGGKMTMLRADKMPNVMGPLAAPSTAGTELHGPRTPGATTPAQTLSVPGGDGAGVSRSRLGAPAEASKRAAIKTLTMQDMLATLQHNPRYAHSQLHYKFLQMEHGKAK